jgi:hypothetical protein
VFFAGIASAQRQRQRQVAVRPPLRQSTTASLKDPAHLKKVARRVRMLTSWVTDGEQGKDEKGEESSFFHAAFAEVIPAPGIKQKRLWALSYEEGPKANPHATDKPARHQVSGIGPDGIYRGHVLGTTSVHDLVPSADEPSQADWDEMERRTNARIAEDYIRLSYDHGPGTPRVVIADKVKAQATTAIPVEIPMNPQPGGLTRILYERIDVNGRIQGPGISGYMPGRIIELVR